MELLDDGGRNLGAAVAMLRSSERVLPKGKNLMVIRFRGCLPRR